MNEDKRFRNADEKIKTAFLDLLQEKGFKAITIRMITEKARVNRSTFYAHYVDKYDLLDQIENMILEELKEINRPFAAREFICSGSENADLTDLKCYIENIVRYLKAKGKIITVLLSEKGELSFTNKLSQAIFDLWISRNIMELLRIPPQYARAAIMGMMTSVISEWIKSDFKENDDKVADILLMLTSTLLEGLTNENNDRG